MSLKHLWLGVFVSVVCVACGSSGSGGKDTGTSDSVAADVLKRVDEPFGRACDDVGKECPDKDLDGKSLTCIGINGGASGKGFCSRGCLPPPNNPGSECYGVPNGQWAGCVLTTGGGEDQNGQPIPEVHYCAYLCKSAEGSWDCPGTLHCGTADEDGTAFCVP